MRGTLREPRLTFFSEPSVPQSQIVSLLLAGGSLQSVQDQSRAGTPGASQEVAGQAAALLVSQFGSKLGIPDISVESDLSNETSLVLGKYLSPRLYVSWGVSLTEAINTFKMRYTIDDRWTVKTEAGKDTQRGPGLHRSRNEHARAVRRTALRIRWRSVPGITLLRGFADSRRLMPLIERCRESSSISPPGDSRRPDHVGGHDQLRSAGLGQ